jgi:hypothetical protein
MPFDLLPFHHVALYPTTYSNVPNATSVPAEF